MKTIFKNIMIITLSVFSLSSSAQCPSITNINSTLGANGTATLSASISGSINPAQNGIYWQIYSNTTISAYGQQTTFQFPANGTYSVCVSLTDTTNACSTNQLCDVIQITNMSANSCIAGFSYYTDSACVTHFTNNSMGSNLTYQWYNQSNNSTLVGSTSNLNLNLPNGTHNISLYTFSNGQNCDSITQAVTVSCGSNTTTPTGCQTNASFTLFSDSVTIGNFFAYNTSTGNGVLSYLWDFGDGNTSTQQYPFHQYATPGQYIICLQVTSNTNGQTCTSYYCDSSSVGQRTTGFLMSSLSVMASPTSIKENDFTKINAYPNPLSDELTLDLGVINEKSLSYIIIDALGRTVSKGLIENTIHKITTSDYQKGFYTLLLFDNSGNIKMTKKLIK